MAYELRDGQLNIFKNKHKKGDNPPSARGEFMWNGELLEVALWSKKDKNGEPYYSGQVKRKEPRAPVEPAWGSDRKAEPGFDDDSDVPF